MAPRKITDGTLANFTITLLRGTAYSQVFIHKSAGVPTNLTGKDVVFKFKDVFEDLFVLSSADAPTALGSSVEITDAVDGEFTLYLSPEETETAELTTSGCGHWWIEFVESGVPTPPIWVDKVVVLDI